MKRNVTPESAGIPSRNLLTYLRILGERGLAMHSVLIARGDDVVLEAYWAPFDEGTAHRMYSQTKSYVGLAIRLLAEDGLLSLDDPITDYFPEALPATIHPYLRAQTLRNMLMMRTAFDEGEKWWFTEHGGDRVKMYFAQTPTVYPGTQYHYDSNGSFILGALVEKLTGKTFLDYLRDKCLRGIGFSEEAHCLRCPGGYSWGDSALLCTPLDMLKFGRLVGRFGEWEGEQIIPRHIIEDALADATANFTAGYRGYASMGYASQLWRFLGNSFGFNGMHDQLTLYDPDTDVTFTCTAGNLRTPAPRELIVSYLFTEVLANVTDPCPADPEGDARLCDYVRDLALVTAGEPTASAIEEEISGKTFVAEENAPGIRSFSLTFDDDACLFRYENARGAREIRFGRGKNLFATFPEPGYSGPVGGEVCEGNLYRCASSFAWENENQLTLITQIIDDYIGNLYLTFSYRDGHGRLRLVGDAENFLLDYNGTVNATLNP